ncbi:MAG: T9SS type A sorting domain-containing protein [Fibrobacterota bacterium]
MDYSIWNPDWVGYIYNFLVKFPPEWENGDSWSIIHHIEGHTSRLPEHIRDAAGDNIWIRNECVAKEDNSHQSWYYGHFNKTGDTIVNYTEYRIIKEIMFVAQELKGDINRVFSFGHSMGGSGNMTLGARYPMIISAVYASQPATDFGNTDFVYYPNVLRCYGTKEQNLPIKNLVFDDPAFPGIDEHLQRYNGTPVYDWQNTREQLTVRAGDEMALLMSSHGRNDAAIDWETQGAPYDPAVRNSRRAFKHVVDDSRHTFQGFDAFGSIKKWFFPGSKWWIANPFAFDCDKSMPGFSGINSGNSLESVIWTVIQDSPDVWEMQIEDVGQTCDVTPRRCQQFFAIEGDLFDVYVDGSLHQSNVAADEFGLVTAVDVPLSSTRTIKIENVTRSTDITKKGKKAPQTAKLDAFPNPFNPEIRLRVTTAKKGRVLMSIFDTQGRLVKTVMDRVLPEGQIASAYWNSTDKNGKAVPAGVYIASAKTENGQLIRKIVLEK